MKVSFRIQSTFRLGGTHCSWRQRSQYEVIDRRHVELVEETWAKAPYHAAEELEPSEARMIVNRGIKAAHKNAKRQMEALLKRTVKNGHKVAACAVLMGAPMPDWSTDEILAVHFRMHKAEGVLFREALLEAAKACELKFVPVPRRSWASLLRSHYRLP
jgi:hypothetical protein